MQCACCATAMPKPCSRRSAGASRVRPSRGSGTRTCCSTTARPGRRDASLRRDRSLAWRYAPRDRGPGGGPAAGCGDDLSGRPEAGCEPPACPRRARQRGDRPQRAGRRGASAGPRHGGLSQHDARAPGARAAAHEPQPLCRGGSRGPARGGAQPGARRWLDHARHGLRVGTEAARCRRGVREVPRDLAAPAARTAVAGACPQDPRRDGGQRARLPGRAGDGAQARRGLVESRRPQDVCLRGCRRGADAGGAARRPRPGAGARSAAVRARQGVRGSGRRPGGVRPLPAR